jgi:micrococcal nuclease
VRRVVDGDTVSVGLGGRDEKVRLLGIDTPESVNPDTPVECFAKEASARTAALLPPGTSVRLVRDVEERDRYGRLLAYVYRVSDGLFVNLDLVRGGYARLLTHPPNVAHTDELVDAARAARESRRGLWAACLPQ